jgi:predicted GNAT superfamily acetyltransferase
VAGSQALAEIRQLFQLAEFEEVLRLQQAIWGFADIDILPVRFLVVVSQVGGHVFGAYDGDMMVGFCFAIPGIKAGGLPYLHSHMLGVLPAYHNAGIGRRLKLRTTRTSTA